MQWYQFNQNRVIYHRRKSLCMTVTAECKYLPLGPSWNTDNAKILRFEILLVTSDIIQMAICTICKVCSYLHMNVNYSNHEGERKTTRVFQAECYCSVTDCPTSHSFLNHISFRSLQINWYCKTVLRHLYRAVY